MAETEIQVSRITTGEELKEARKSYRTPELGHPGWGDSIEAGRSNVFAARIDEAVVGYAVLSLVGPHARDTQFREVLETVYPDEEKPTAVAYGFRTKRQARNLGVAKAIGRVMEERVLELPDVMPRIALSVAIDNAPALSVYDALDYKVLIANGVGVFKIQVPRYRNGRQEVAVLDEFFMAKDL